MMNAVINNEKRKVWDIKIFPACDVRPQYKTMEIGKMLYDGLKCRVWEAKSISRRREK